MTAQARTALEAAWKAHTSDYVIEWGGDAVKSLRRAFGQACRAAKLAGVTPHVMRHSAAVAMAEADVPMAVIAQYLGHGDSRVTERVYGRYSPEYLRRASAALE
jgi:integrase